MSIIYYAIVIQTAILSWMQSGEVEILKWTYVMEDFKGGYLSRQKGGGY